MKIDPDRPLCLRVDKPVFHGIFSRLDRALVFAWGADTNVQNIKWVRLLVFRLGWPPVKWAECFTSKEEL